MRQVRFGLMPMLQENRQSQIQSATASTPEKQQRRRMLIALVVLLLALVMVLIKDRQLLFPSTAESTTPDATAEEAEPETTTTPAPVAVEKVPAPSVPQKAPKKAAKKTSGRAERKSIVANLVSDTTPNSAPIVVAATRAMLPPLEVEVVAGNQRHTIDAGSNSVNVKMQDALSPQIPGAEATEPAAPEHVQLAPGTAEMLSHPVDPSYPLLAKQMKVQGAVILEALISKTGAIQDIQVLSGPAILSAAAREAVRQWRFKPYLQSGKPVDSEARITVNFTISTY